MRLTFCRLSLYNGFMSIEIINCLIEDICTANKVTESVLTDFSLIRSKDGVWVFSCLFESRKAIAKYFQNEGDKREIVNYQRLNNLKIPTIKVLAYGNSCILLEDLNFSLDWRLGTAEDMADCEVAHSLAKWYFDLHENGLNAKLINLLYCEYDQITKETLYLLKEKMPECYETFDFILQHFVAFRKLIDNQNYTLTYNDFFWTNLAVKQDKSEALMFDYNLLGRGIRYSDMRNVESLETAAYKVFRERYDELYKNKYNHLPTFDNEQKIDDIAGCIFSLYTAFNRTKFPSWANEAKAQAENGILLTWAKNLLI